MSTAMENSVVIHLKKDPLMFAFAIAMRTAGFLRKGIAVVVKGYEDGVELPYSIKVGNGDEDGTGIAEVLAESQSILSNVSGWAVKSARLGKEFAVEISPL